MSDDIINALGQLGIPVVDGKVKKADFLRVFGATFCAPEWILAADFNLKVPSEYTNNLALDQNKYGRVANPSTFMIARYGKFMNQGKECIVDGLVYQYSKLTNPRNIGFGWKVFCNGEPMDKNSSIRSAAEAKQECDQAAAALIETLVDL